MNGSEQIRKHISRDRKTMVAGWFTAPKVAAKKTKINGEINEYHCKKRSVEYNLGFPQIRVMFDFSVI